MTRQYEYEFSICTWISHSPDQLAGISESLAAQSMTDFEWIIVADGSNESIREAVHEVMAPANLPVQHVDRYCPGEHIAVNSAVPTVRGRFFIMLPVDVRLLPQALERLKYHWETIPPAHRDSFAAVIGSSEYPDGSSSGGPLPSSPFDATGIEVSAHRGVGGPVAGCIKTLVLKEHPIPQFEGEDFMPMELVLNRIGSTALTRYVDEAFFVLASRNKKMKERERRKWIDNPRGAALFYGEASARRMPIARLFRTCAQYVRFSLHVGVIPDEIYRNSARKAVTFFMLWPGLFLYRRDLRK